MENRNKEKQENRKIAAKFAILLVVCFAVGIAAGALTAKIQEMQLDFGDTLCRIRNHMAYGVPALMLCMHVATGLICWWILRKGKKSIAAWNGEEEESIKRTENALGIGIFLSNIMQILNSFLYAAGLHLGDSADLPESHRKWILLAVLLLFAAGLFLMMVVQKKIVDAVKLINPEKRGNILDVHFQKKWEESCDEAQQLYIYKASYASFRAVQFTCILLWVICVCADLAFQTGLFPVLLVSILWMVSTVTYMIATVKLEK